ncbi:hypothetical protein [Actinomadura sp. 21ATH]|uniref:hypothetical protein n=1 Tax=Actinomadura sp. 21ATH TaxID=1735444 RepID=UPI0035BF89A6
MSAEPMSNERLAELTDADRLHAVIEAALIAYWCLEKGKGEPDQLDLAAAVSHAFVLVDALRHAGLPIECEEGPDPHGVREAVTGALQTLRDKETTP